MRSFIIGLFTLGFLFGCGTPAPDPVCAAGQQIACACPNGATGAQICRADGSGYDACEGCVDPGDGGTNDAGTGCDGTPAGTPEDCGNFELIAPASCAFSKDCQAECTRPHLIAACDGECHFSADVACIGGCEASCEADCQSSPGTVDCTGHCTTNCNAACSASCVDSSCLADCNADCSNRCAIGCAAVPPSAPCDVKCAVSCDGVCEVQANIDCLSTCLTPMQGLCATSCQSSTGAIFCGQQYVAADDVCACLGHLAEAGFSVP